jgi:ribosome-binding factor A
MSQRITRINALLQREISEQMRRYYRADTAAITISDVSVSADLRNAKIYYSVLGDDAEIAASQKLFRRIGKDIRQRVSREITLKYFPDFLLCLRSIPRTWGGDQRNPRSTRPRIKMTDKKFYPEDSARFAAEIEKLKGQRVAVLGHQRPDGDCIGSTVAVVRVLKSLGIEAIGLNRDATPATLEAFVGETPMVSSCRLYTRWSRGRIC